jgi:hypothetical protein
VKGFEAGLLAGAVAGALLAELIAVLRVARRRWRAQCAAWDVSSQAAVDAYRAGEHDGLAGAGVDASPEERMWIAESMPAEVTAHSAAVVEAGRIVEAELRRAVPHGPVLRAWMPGQRDRRAR